MNPLDHLTDGGSAFECRTDYQKPESENGQEPQKLKISPGGVHEILDSGHHAIAGTTFVLRIEQLVVHFTRD